MLPGRLWLRLPGSHCGCLPAALRLRFLQGDVPTLLLQCFHADLRAVHLWRLWGQQEQFRLPRRVSHNLQVHQRERLTVGWSRDGRTTTLDPRRSCFPGAPDSATEMGRGAEAALPAPPLSPSKHPALCVCAVAPTGPPSPSLGWSWLACPLAASLLLLLLRRGPSCRR